MSQDRVAISGNQKSRIGHYELLDTIGKGSYAKVRRGRHIPTGTEVAVKVVRWHTSSRLRKLQQREVDCMKALDHPNIVKLFEVIDTRESLFLVMEYLSGGDLFSYLEGHGPMTEDEARGPFRQLVSAVQYCHQKGIVHRDLKPENVLFDAQRTVRLADFGLSAQFDDSKLRTLCGTLPYAAPELFLGLGYYGPPVDVWSLGVLLYNMLTGTLPFQGEEFWRLRQQILSGHYEQPAGVSLGGQVLLKKLMNLEPTERGSLTEVMPDPWLNQGQEEGLRPYSEPPCEDMDPGVMRRMTELGFEWERIQDSVKTRKYDSVMATYVMLCAAKHEVKCRNILVRPFHSRHPSSDSSGPSSALEAGPGSSGLCRELQESGQQAEEPTRPPASPVASSATPAPGPESGTATPSSAPLRGPGDSPPTDGTSPSSPGGGDGGGGGGGDSGGGGGGDSGGDSSSGGGGNGGTPDTASRRRPGLARRFLNFILSKLCCRPFRARRGKRNRVAPL